MRIDSSPIHPASLPTYSIDTFRLPEDQSREVWRSVVDGTFELEGRAGTEHAHRVRTQVWFLEELLLAQFAGEANVVHRTRALAERDPAPVLKVRIYRSGHSLLIDGDTQTMMGTGAIHFIDHDRPVRQVSSDHEQFTVSIPHHAVGYDRSIHPACFSIGLDTVRGRMIEAGLTTLIGEIETVGPAEAPALSATVVGLLRGALAGSFNSQDDEGIRHARISAFKRYIDQNLADPGLGMESLLREFGASRATIYRDFADVGGLQHYILDRRLHRAYRFLAEASPNRGHVQNVASRCGFASLPHFSRRFRTNFGVAPSDVVGRWGRAETTLAAIEKQALLESSDNPATIAALQWAYMRFR